MIILSFDQSISRTGWCVHEPPTLSNIIFGSFTSAPEKKMSTEAKTGIFCDEIEKLFETHKPDFVVWEAATEIIRSYVKQGREDLAGQAPVGLTVNADQLILRDIQGHIRHAARSRHIPYEAVNPKTWRAAILKNGNLSRDDAKRKAVEYCKSLRIHVKNADQAEAVCVALWGATCQSFKYMKGQAA